MSTDPADPVYDRADRRLREQLGGMDLDALLEEHRHHPYGPHSDELARLLTSFRKAGVGGKYVIYSQGDDDGWVIGRLNVRDGRPRIYLETVTVYASSALAQHAVLEARLENLRNPVGEAP